MFPVLLSRYLWKMRPYTIVEATTDGFGWRVLLVGFEAESRLRLLSLTSRARRTRARKNHLHRFLFCQVFSLSFASLYLESREKNEYKTICRKLVVSCDKR
jgi:hypothetical protein